jgi:hypothetical protein
MAGILDEVEEIPWSMLVVWEHLGRGGSLERENLQGVISEDVYWVAGRLSSVLLMARCRRMSEKGFACSSLQCQKHEYNTGYAHCTNRAKNRG